MDSSLKYDITGLNIRERPIHWVIITKILTLSTLLFDIVIHAQLDLLKQGLSSQSSFMEWAGLCDCSIVGNSGCTQGILGHRR